MSWKIGFILLKSRWQGAETDLLDELGLTEAGEPRKLHIDEATKLYPSTTAVAVGDDYTMILNDLLPYDLSFEPPFSWDLDESLKNLSKTAPVLAGFMDGATSTYGFCIFEKGKVTRARQVVSARLETNFGELCPEENETSDEEAAIFALTTRWLGEPLYEFFFKPAFSMKVYET